MANRFISLSILASFLALSYGSAAQAQPNAPTQTQRPNVLIIMADDVGYMDFGAYGGEAATPAIDAIAARGIKMSRYYTSPQCGPSRAMLLTGADNHEVGMAMIPETLPDEMRETPAYSMKWPQGTLTLGRPSGRGRLSELRRRQMAYWRCRRKFAPQTRV